MTVITTSILVDKRVVAKRIKDWLQSKGFETKALEAGGTYTVKARKSSAIRSVVGADRALEISVRHLNGETQVGVSQGSWKTNIVSNAAWLVVTGGMNLLISGWSVVIQKDLETFVRSVLAELSGSHEVSLDSPDEIDLATARSVTPVITSETASAIPIDTKPILTKDVESSNLFQKPPEVEKPQSRVTGIVITLLILFLVGMIISSAFMGSDTNGSNVYVNQVAIDPKQPIALNCGKTAGYSTLAERVYAKGDDVYDVNVTYIGKKPPNKQIEAALRDCLNLAIQKDASKDIVANAWFRNKAGANPDSDEVLSPEGGNKYMAYNSIKRKVEVRSLKKI